MDLGLSGKIAIVTGASSGLGLATAEALAAEGASVVMVARRADRLAAEATRLGATPVVADMTQPESAAAVVDATIAAHGRVDILVWNTAGPEPGPASAVGEPELQAAFEQVLLPLVRLVGLCLPHMRRNGFGRILAVTAVSVKEPTSTVGLSSSVRPGLVGYLKTLSHEVGPDGITINVVAPGRFATDRLKSVFASRSTEDLVADIPLRRIGDPKEFGNVVCFLASERAAFVSGATLNVDGGMSRSLF